MVSLLHSNFAKFEQAVSLGIIDVNEVDTDGNSILFRNSFSKLELELLIKLGINLDLQNKYGETWLHLWNESRIRALFAILKEKKYNVRFNPNLKHIGGCGHCGNMCGNPGCVKGKDYDRRQKLSVLQKWGECNFFRDGKNITAESIEEFFECDFAFSEPLKESSVPYNYMEHYNKYLARITDVVEFLPASLQKHKEIIKIPRHIFEQHKEFQELRDMVEAKDKELQIKNDELRAKTEEIIAKDKELRAKDETIKYKDDVIASRDKTIETKIKIMEDARTGLENKNKRINGLKGEGCRLVGILKERTEILKAKDAELVAKTKELEQKNKVLMMIINGEEYHSKLAELKSIVSN